jgi:hypothetical protein
MLALRGLPDAKESDVIKSKATSTVRRIFLVIGGRLSHSKIWGQMRGEGSTNSRHLTALGRQCQTLKSAQQAVLNDEERVYTLRVFPFLIGIDFNRKNKTSNSVKALARPYLICGEKIDYAGKGYAR